ncbi:MAG: VWA domain-containing protein, partial [Lysobacteraceae bacterium]
MPLSSRFIHRSRMSVAALALALSAPAIMAEPSESVSILILDASGSMWGQLDGGKSKIEVAREVMAEFFARRDPQEPLGVIAYGHRQRGDCLDIEVVAPPAVHDATDLAAHLAKISPRGMTPISESLRIAAHQIPRSAERADIILVTDGLETCDADPCAMAAELAAQGVSIRAHVVGFGLTSEQANAMRCIADTTGGLLLTPQSGRELSDALARIEQLDAAPAPEPEAFFDIGDKAEAGHSYRIAFRGSAHPADRAGFTARGEDAPSTGPSFGVIGGAGDTGNNPFTKRAPLEPGDYDLILTGPNGSVVARQAIEVVAASNGFDPVGSVALGERF